MGQIEEGFSLEFKPLLSLDGKPIDAVVKCNIDQVEKLNQVMLDVPTPAAPRQRTEIQVPQIDSCRFAEKFHWPTDMVLVIGFGMAPTPDAAGTDGGENSADHARRPCRLAVVHRKPRRGRQTAQRHSQFAAGCTAAIVAVGPELHR